MPNHLQSVMIVLTLIGRGSLSAEMLPDQEAKQPKAETTLAVDAEPEATSASFGNWILRCERTGSGSEVRRICEVVETIQVQGQSAPVAQIAIGRLRKEDPLRLTLVLPTNINLSTGPRISINGAEAVQLAWTKCIPGGCFADLVISDATLVTWRASPANGQIDAKDGENRPLSIAMSFRGLAQALEALTRQR